MDQTQRFDPNKTQMSPGPQGDPNRTTAMQAPGNKPALVASVMSSRTATMANGPAREQFLLELGAPNQEELPGVSTGGARTPLNLCLVLDRSGSMEGPPLQYVKEAVNYVVDLLTPNDVLSIVTFEETVEVLMPPQKVTNKPAIKQGVQNIVSGNTTNLYDGIQLGAQQLKSVGDPGRATRMVVFTDGDPTSGVTDFHSLVQHAGTTKGEGITCTFLGFGPEYNEELLASMSKKAGGNYYYIPQPQLIPEIFRSELETLISVAATNIKLHVKLARWVKLLAATGQSVPPGQREFTLDLADLERGSTLQQVFDLSFDNHPLGHYRVAEGKLQYTDAMSGQPKTEAIDFVIEFTADQSRYSQPPNPRVTQASELSAASRTVEKTIMGLKTQQISTQQAVDELQKTQALLVKDGRTQEAQEVTLALRALQSGDAGGAEKTLMGTMVNLDQGKKRGPKQ